ncbi:hypothetical protein [Kordiimonas aestuarii]|uniref:hypothetical protein n=1 Tax=Kordiimonas aestuarii TaxID=1005925 RepID=UPI0021D1E2BB|nr:hypothetical protein [Kordiimonas aestuarii]
MKQMLMHLRVPCALAAGLWMLTATPQAAFANADAPASASASASVAGKEDASQCKLRLVGRPPYKRNKRMCLDTSAAKPASDDCAAQPAMHPGHGPQKRRCKAV